MAPIALDAEDEISLHGYAKGTTRYRGTERARGQRAKQSAWQSRAERSTSSRAGSQHLSAQHRSDRSLIFIPKHLQRASVAIIPETLLLAFVIIKGSRICLQATRSQEPIFISVRDSSALVSGDRSLCPAGHFSTSRVSWARFIWSTSQQIGVRVPYLYSTVPPGLVIQQNIVSRAEASVHPALLLLVLLIRVAAAVY